MHSDVAGGPEERHKEQPRCGDPVHRSLQAALQFGQFEQRQAHTEGRPGGHRKRHQEPGVRQRHCCQRGHTASVDVSEQSQGVPTLDPRESLCAHEHYQDRQGCAKQRF